MARLDIISEITSRLAPTGVKYFLSAVRGIEKQRMGGRCTARQMVLVGTL